MKKEIHKYQGQRVNGKQVKITDLIKLNKKDQEILNKYIIKLKGSAGEKRVKKLTREILVIHDTVEVGLDEWNIDVLNELLAVLNNTELAKYTKNDYKKNIKTFLKFQYKDWVDRFDGLTQDGLKQEDPVNRKKINKHTLIKPNEFELLVRGCDRPLMRVYVHLAYKSAGRPEELLKLKFKDIDLKKGEVSVFSSKTNKPRTIPIDEECCNDILNYKENQYAYPNPGNEDYVFVSPAKREVSISTPTIYSYLKTVSTEKIKRSDITPYFFRHTRLSFMLGKLSPKMYEKFAGHSLEVGMKFYAHLDVDDLKQELYDRVFDKKEIPKDERDFLLKRIEEQDKIIDDFSKEIFNIKEFMVKKLKKSMRKKDISPQ